MPLPPTLSPLLLLLVLSSPLLPSVAIRVDIYRLAAHDEGSVSQLRLVCQADGPRVLSVRLFCPRFNSGHGQQQQPLCFENCVPTSACIADRVCSQAECTQVIAEEVSGSVSSRKFGYAFRASSDAVGQPSNLTFECRYGGRSSELLVANWWTGVSETSALSRVNSSSSSSVSSSSTTTHSVSTVPTTEGWNDETSTVATGTAGSHPLIGNSAVYIAGFSAVALLSAAVVAILVTYLIVCRGRCRAGLGAANSAASPGDEGKEAAAEQSANLIEMQPRPDLLPDGEHSIIVATVAYSD